MVNDELLRELHEDIRRERLHALWKQFGRHAIGLSVSIVLLTTGIVWWQNHKHEKYTAATAEFLQADQSLNANEFTKALAVLEDIRGHTHGDFSALAGLKQAYVYERLEKKEEALALYKNIYGQSGLSAMVKDMAGLRYVILGQALDAKADVSAVMDSITAKGRPWRASALENKGMMLWSAGNIEEAQKIFTSLQTDPAAPQTLKNRAAMFTGSVPAVAAP